MLNRLGFLGFFNYLILAAKVKKAVSFFNFILNAESEIQELQGSSSSLYCYCMDIVLL